MAGALTIGAELAAAVLWPVPDQASFDVSGRFGAGDTTLRVAALGDSTLTGPGVGSVDEIWAQIVATRLADRMAVRVDLRSWAAGGATASEVVEHQLEPAIAFEPHVALVSIGANDVIRSVPMRRFAASLDTIVGKLTGNGCLVVCSGVGDLGTIPRLAPPLRHLVSRLGQRADNVHRLVANRHDAIKVEQWGWSSDQFRRRGDVWSADRFHPNPAGHQVWAETCWVALEPALSELQARLGGRGYSHPDGFAPVSAS